MREDHDRPSRIDPDRADATDQDITPAQASAEERQLAALRRARQGRVAKVLVALAIIAILIVFVISNSQPVPVDFVFVTRHPRLIWVMFACAVLGGIAGFLIGKPGRQVLGSKKDDERDARKGR